MVAKQGLESYLNTSIDTLDAGKLIVLLYDKLEEKLQLAIDRLNDGDMMGKGNAILKSQDIIMELLSSLNLKTGQIAINLQAIYLFMFRELNRINLEKDVNALKKVLRAVQELKSAWVEITTKKKSETTQAKHPDKRQQKTLAIVA
ncbi:MAG: flagellar export chaperone FliS [Calditrichaeota bacterium]|nr:flagellar export chaperone FliS [Calditrichota bacterium]